MPALLARLEADEALPVLARELFAMQAAEHAQMQARIAVVEARLPAWHRADERSRRPARTPGVGPIGATMLTMKTPAPEAFRSGRQFAAWIGPTPKDHSTAGKARPGVITRAGDEALRSGLVVGATALIRRVREGRSRDGHRFAAWVQELVAVALADKLARIAWKLMVTGEACAARPAPAATSAP